EDPRDGRQVLRHLPRGDEVPDHRRRGPDRLPAVPRRAPQPGAALGFIERTFGETRRRTKVIGRLPGETSCLTLVWAVLDGASAGWRGFTMTSDGLRLLQDLRRSLLKPLRQLRPRTAATQPDDQSETVRATAYSHPSSRTRARRCPPDTHATRPARAPRPRRA